MQMGDDAVAALLNLSYIKDLGYCFVQDQSLSRECDDAFERILCYQKSRVQRFG